jgi:hypothetical protein
MCLHPFLSLASFIISVIDFSPSQFARQYKIFSRCHPLSLFPEILPVTKAFQVVGQMSPIINCKYVTLTTKRALFNNIFLPTLCYQCQTWTMTSHDRRKITTIEIKCLRRILGVTRRDRIRNEEIREKSWYNANINIHQEITG